MSMDIIKRAVYAVYSDFPNRYGAQRALIFLDKRFGCLTIGNKTDPFTVYAGYYELLSGERIACMSAVNALYLTAAGIEKAARRIEKHADKQATYTATQYAEMCTALKAEIKTLAAEGEKLKEARTLGKKYFDTIGSGAQAVLKAHRELNEHCFIKLADINDGSLILWAYLQGVRSERARHRGAGEPVEDKTHIEGTESPTNGF